MGKFSLLAKIIMNIKSFVCSFIKIKGLLSTLTIVTSTVFATTLK